MAARPQTKMGKMVRALPQDAKDTLYARVDAILPQCVENIFELANGVLVEDDSRLTKSGEPAPPRVYKRPPDREANIFFMHLRLGVPRQQSDPVVQQLQTAQAQLICQQVEVNLPAAQQRELTARAVYSETNAAFFPQQFVTEDQERKNLSALVAAFNRPLIGMTPEKLLGVLPELGSVAQASLSLERLKGLLMRGQQEVLEEAAGKEQEADDEEDDE